MHRRHLLQGLAVCAAAPATAFAAPWRDVLDTPALPSPLAPRAPLFALARAGTRVVAAGQRGHVLWSDDTGRRWQQAEVPVSSDLTGMHFADAEHGWAVGHDGVVLHSADGGRRWQRQLDGRGLGPVLLAQAQALGEEKAVAEARRFADQGAENPFLDCWFDDTRNGHVVGAFGLLLRTRDGGRSWESRLHAADNPKGLHLYAVRRIGGELLVAGEQGLLLKLDRASDRFVALALPYRGTLFGVVGHERALLAHGLRGNLLRSTDGGRGWQAVNTGLGVGLTGSTLDARGRFVVVSQAGHVLASSDDGASFAPLKVERPQPAAAVVAAADGTLVLAGPRGLSTLA